MTSRYLADRAFAVLGLLGLLAALAALAALLLDVIADGAPRLVAIPHQLSVPLRGVGRNPAGDSRHVLRHRADGAHGRSRRRGCGRLPGK